MDVEKIAQSLWDSNENKVTIDPIRTIIGETDIALAYKIQNVNTVRRLEQGAEMVGKKIGLTSFAVQKQFGITQPDFGILFNDMEVLNGQSISFKEIMQPKVEAEIAFVLADDLDMENISMLDVLNSIDYALPAIEIVGSRIKDWNIKITDTVADNASASHYVIGHRPRTMDEFDVVNCQMKLMKNGELASSGSGAACLGSPLNAVYWLAKKMVEMGNPLQEGELIFSGALGPMVNVAAGDKIEVEIEGLSTVQVSFDE